MDCTGRRTVFGFFAPKTSFDLAHWFTPAPLDTEPFQVVQKSKTSIALQKSFTC